MRKRVAALAAAAAPLLALTIGTAPAHAGTVVPAFPTAYHVAIQFDNGLCLDVPNADAHSGQYVRQWGCNSTNAQSWNLLKIDYTHFKVQSTVNTGLCLNNWEGGDQTGNHIVLYNCGVTDGDGQFNMINTGGGTWGHTEFQPKSAAANCVNMWGGDDWGNYARLFPCGDAPNENISFH